MTGYALRRLLWGVLLAVLATAVVFLIFYALPSGDPAVARAGDGASESQIEAVRDSLGLDDPLLFQYGNFLGGLASLDLGESYMTGVSVNQQIADRLPVTLLLVSGAIVIWLLAGVGAGAMSAARPGSFFDRAVGGFSLALLSSPVFWLGYVALYLFAEGAGALLPALPGIGSYLSADSIPQKLGALLLPWLVLGLSSAAIYARLTRATVREEFSKDHVLAARARGLSERRVLWRHAVQPGMSPVITLFGIDIGLILAGNVVLVETVFNVPGLGSLLTGSIENSDLPVIQGITLVAALFVVAANVVADLVYAAVDPRVRLERD